MYAFIKGKLFSIEDGSVVVENNGIGYQILVSGNTIFKLGEKGSEIMLFLYQQVKEDGISLFGFLSLDEKRMFEKLITVSGVGCKMAIQILSGLDTKMLAISIANKDVAYLSKIKGIGKKTAERIILELREKVDLGKFESSELDILPYMSNEVNDAITALIGLGITRGEAVNAVANASKQTKNTNDIIAIALKSMDRLK